MSIAASHWVPLNFLCSLFVCLWCGQHASMLTYGSKPRSYSLTCPFSYSYSYSKTFLLHFAMVCTNVCNPGFGLLPSGIPPLGGALWNRLHCSDRSSDGACSYTDELSFQFQQTLFTFQENVDALSCPCYQREKRLGARFNPYRRSIRLISW